MRWVVNVGYIPASHFPNIKLDTTHLKRLRLTCKAFGHTLAAPVLRRLTISAKFISLKVMVHNLQCLTEAECITAEATRELKIEDLSLFSCGRQQRQNITANEESDMRRRIHTAITSLKAVTTLTCVL